MTEAPSQEKHWYCVRVQSGREESVADALRRRVHSAGLDTQITEVLVPTEKVTEIRGGKKQVREKKLYPGYIMVEMLMNRDTWFVVRETPGIGDFLGLKEPIPMKEHEIAKIKAAQATSEEDRPKIRIDFAKGDTVRVKEGPFENFEGMVEEIDETKGRIRVTITIFGRATTVDLEYWQVEKL